MMKKNYYLICVLLLAAFCTTSIATAQNYFGDFPVKADPKTVGNKLSRRLMETKHQLYFDRGIHYAEVCTWYGALRFAELTNNKELIKLLRNRFELLFHLEKELLPPPIHVYNPQIQISAESETKRSIFREKDKTKRSKKESAQHSKSRNKSFVMTSVSAL